MTRILVVEDESAIAELVAMNLEHAGFEVEVARDGAEAQTAIDRILPQLVLLDWLLHGDSGHALLRRWRQAPGQAIPPAWSQRCTLCVTGASTRRHGVDH